jgi:AhpC/TSA family
MRIADWLVNGTILLVCGFVVQSMLRTKQSPVVGDQPQVLRAGDRIGSPPELHLDAAERTLIMVVQKSCSYCAQSIPFYQQLAKDIGTSPGDTQLLVASRDDLDSSRRYLQENRIDITKVIALDRQLTKLLRILGTPTLILVTRDGEVRHTWFGKLSESGEHEVRAALQLSP